MTEELQAEGYEFNPAAGKTVRAYINQLEDDLSETALLLANTSRAKETLEGDYADARAKLQSCQQQMQELREGYERDVAEAQREYEASVAEYKADYEKANQLQEEWYAKFESEREARKESVAQLTEQVQDLNTTVTELREELERKKPQPVEVTEGEILQADATEGIVIINLGEREEIETGEMFTVMRVVTGGDLVPKGVVKVVRVEDLTARADIIEMDPDHIIMKGDIVRRQKQVTESM